MGRFFTTLWMGGWGIAFLWGANQVVIWGMMLEDNGWLYSGLAVLVVALLLVLSALRLLAMAFAVLTGRISARLARRYFRDIVADALFSFRTGGFGFKREEKY